MLLYLAVKFLQVRTRLYFLLDPYHNINNGKKVASH